MQEHSQSPDKNEQEPPQSATPAPAAAAASRARDPYLSSHRCINRLLKEHAEHKRLIVAFDFDDTIFDYHARGFTYPRVISLLQRAQSLGFLLTLFTAKPRPDWLEIEQHLAILKLRADSINCNPIPLPFGQDGKPYFNILLDDRAGFEHACSILEYVMFEIQLDSWIDRILIDMLSETRLAFEDIRNGRVRSLADIETDLERE